jgi:hypothetical protein
MPTVQPIDFAITGSNSIQQYATAPEGQNPTMIDMVEHFKFPVKELPKNLKCSEILLVKPSENAIEPDRARNSRNERLDLARQFQPVLVKLPPASRLFQYSNCC